MKKFSVILLITLLLTLFALPISADELDRVIVEEPELINPVEQEMLEKTIDSLIDEYHFDFVIVIHNDLEYSTPRVAADDYFDNGNYGYGTSRDGILLLVSVADRDWYISTSGSGISEFSDRVLDEIGEDIAACLSDGDYYEAAKTFLNSSEAVLRGDYKVKKEFPLFAELIVLALSIAVAFIIAGAVKRSMNTVRQQSGASNYVDSKGIDLTVARDTYLYSTVSKVKIESSSSGGSSSHRSSSGRSHGGRGGKF